jgi:hypothetical protein
MKKNVLTLVFFVFASFGMLTTANASNNINYNDSFTFVEGNINFAVFPNGEFDFYLNQPNNVRVNVNGPNMNISFNAGYNYNAYVQYDRFGAVIQIENIPVFYDYYGRVTQIGSIQINYNNGRLIRLGGMNVYYNNYGAYAYHRGYINTYNRVYVYNPYPTCFVKPYFDYRVVSYQPYRKHYKEIRYKYNNNHSKNNYYSQSNKPKNNSKNYGEPVENKRVATNVIPERINERNVVDYQKNAENSVRRTAERLSTNKKVVESKQTTSNINSRQVQQKRTPIKIEEKTRAIVTTERVNKRTM